MPVEARPYTILNSHGKLNAACRNEATDETHSGRLGVFPVSKRPLLTFVLLGIFFLLFGLTSINLFFLLKANLNLFLEYGLMVIDDGALEQLAELLGSAYLSMLFWLAVQDLRADSGRALDQEALRLALDETRTWT